MGAQNSRLVIKIGTVQLGNGAKHLSPSKGMYGKDHIRFRIRWSEMQVTLNDTQLICKRSSKIKFTETALSRFAKTNSNKGNRESNMAHFAQTFSENLSSDQKVIAAEYFEASKGQKLSHVMVAQMTYDRFTVDYQRIFKESNKASRRVDSDESERTQLGEMQYAA